MLVGDLIYNDEFDCNCKIEIYHCMNDDQSWHEAECIFNTNVDGWNKPLNIILDMNVKYITVQNNILIIEAREREDM